jgi:biopolymer transport protein ExbD
MDKRLTLRTRRGAPVAPASLSILDAAFVTFLFVVASASFLQIPLETIVPLTRVPIEEPPTRIVVWVHEAGGFDVNGRAVRSEDLTPRLQSLVALRPGMAVQVVAPPVPQGGAEAAIDARLIARALEAARAAGAVGVTVSRLIG